MTVESPTFDNARGRSADAGLAWLRRNGWTLGLIVFFFLLLGFTRIINPNYGVTGVQALAIFSVLPLALAAVAQAICVIAGGIDSLVDRFDDGADQRRVGRGEDGGAASSRRRRDGRAGVRSRARRDEWRLVVLTRVPDIVVTLAMAFVWAGCALLVLPTPGAALPQWLRDLVLGSLGNERIRRRRSC